MREREEGIVRWQTIEKEGERKETKLKSQSPTTQKEKKKFKKLKRRNDSQQPKKNYMDFANLTNNDRTCS